MSSTLTSAQEPFFAVNFVGGWINEGCCHAAINPVLFQRIGAFSGPLLSIYGEEDSYYSIAHSKSNVAEMDALGANSATHIVTVPGFRRGYWVMIRPELWNHVVRAYVAKLTPCPRLHVKSST